MQNCCEDVVLEFVKTHSENDKKRSCSIKFTETLHRLNDFQRFLDFNDFFFKEFTQTLLDLFLIKKSTSAVHNTCTYLGRLKHLVGLG